VQNVSCFAARCDFAIKGRTKIQRSVAVGLSVKLNYIATWAAIGFLAAILLGFF
jgi:hypothetical protein